MSSSTNQTTLNRHSLYRQTDGILNANSLHFILISLLFLPFTFYTYAALHIYFSSLATKFDPFNLFIIKSIITSSHNLLTLKAAITVLAFCCFVILPTVAGIALIIYSTNQVIQHKPITFSSTVRSLSHSYIPLLYTVVAGSIKLIILFLAFTLSSIAIIEAIKVVGLDFGLFFFSTLINSIISCVLAITTLFFIVIWGSAASITVLEPKSGFESLRQSANQSSEFRHHSFSIVFIAGFGIGITLSYSTVLQNSVSAANWMYIVQVGFMSLQSCLMILLYVVANTVLYVQCKVASGEEIAKTMVEGEPSGEYVRLVVNDKDGEVSHEHAKKANPGLSYTVYLLTIVWGNFIMCVILSSFYVA